MECRDKELISINEKTALLRESKTKVVDTDSGETFDNSTPVSMNCWGFPKGFLELLEGEFESFLADLARHDKLTGKEEFFLPSAVDALHRADKMKVEVALCDSQWFGVTYAEDKASVTREIARMHQAGQYPESLEN